MIAKLIVLIWPLLLFALPANSQNVYPLATVDARGDSIIINTVEQGRKFIIWHDRAESLQKENELLMYENTMASAYIADLEIMNGNLQKQNTTRGTLIDNLRLQNAGLSDDVKYYRKKSKRNAWKWGLSGAGAGLLGGIITGIIVSR